MRQPSPTTRTIALVAAFTVAVLVCVGAVVVGTVGNRTADPTDRVDTAPTHPTTDPSVAPAPTTAPVADEPTVRPARGPRASASSSLRQKPRTTDSVEATHVFPLSGCDVDYSAAHHDYPATDMFASRGCLFVSPVAGRVDEVGRVNRWSSSTNIGADRGGLFVSVVGVDGVRYYGSHLESVLPAVAPGTQVQPGTPLGHVGDTGSAAGTGTHLHFGLSWPTAPGYWWIRRGAVPPSRYLDAWKARDDLSPVAEVGDARRRYGDDSRCRDYC